MPLYEYQCTACHVSFDLLRRFSEADTPAVCPQCGGCDTKRAISRFATLGGGASDFGGDYGGGEGASAEDGSAEDGGSAGGGCSGCSSGNCAHCKH
jgi:putative FmdB family regulatory protein